MRKVTGLDIFLGRRVDDSDDSEQGSEGSSESASVAVEEFHKKRWNLNQPLGGNREIRRMRFDIINMRMLAEGIDSNRWSSLLIELRSLLVHNGWLQCCEFNFSAIQLDGGRYDLAPNLRTWSALYRDSMTHMNRDPRVATSLRRLLRAAGFQNVQEMPYRLPIGSWEPSECSNASNC